MDRTSLVRLRWRLTGAWLWPCFLVLTVVDAAVVHWLPPTGDSEGAVGAWLLSTALMLLAVALFSPLISLVIRRARRDLPKPVARNYAGTYLALGVSLALAVAGMVHHHVVTRDRASMIEVSQRAKAWIGTHAPRQFMSDLNEIDLDAIEPPNIYRACVADVLGTRDYCVVVDRTKPFGSSVRYSGREPNELLEQGAS